MNLKSKIYDVRRLPLLILAMLVNILSQATHETGHHMVYQVMGRDPVWGFTKLVQIWDRLPMNPDEWMGTFGSEGEQGWLKLGSQVASQAEGAINSAAGPLAGLSGAIFGLVVARWSKKTPWRQIGLAFAMSASLVAVLYYIRSPMRTGGDEYDIATQLGVAKSLIEIPFALAFWACLILVLRALPLLHIRLSWLGTIFLGSVATGLLMVIADNFVIAQVDAGNPWFQPVIGYSLPVFLANGFTLIGLMIWARWQNREGEQFVKSPK